MKFILPLLLVLISYSNLYTQVETLNFETFIPSNDREPGTAEVSGDIDNTADILNLAINYNGFSSPMTGAYIHLGTPSNPGRTLLKLNLDKTETNTDGFIGRSIIGILHTLTKDQSKSQITRRIDNSIFNEIADAIDADNACIILEVGGVAFAAPLRKAVDVAVPTMSQWSIFILGLMISSLALIYLKMKSTSTV